MSSLLEEEHLVAPVTSSQPLPSDSPRALPIPTFILAREIDGLHTDLLIQTFDDRVFVSVTQLNGRLGCLVSVPSALISRKRVDISLGQTHASLPSTIPLSRPSTSSTNPNSILSILPPPSSSINLTPLLGSPPSQAMQDLYASQISTLIWMVLETKGLERRSVVIGLAMKPTSEDEDDDESKKERKRFEGVMELVAKWNGPE
jgi:hypothetical protein